MCLILVCMLTFSNIHYYNYKNFYGFHIKFWIWITHHVSYIRSFFYRTIDSIVVAYGKGKLTSFMADLNAVFDVVGYQFISCYRFVYRPLMNHFFWSISHIDSIIDVEFGIDSSRYGGKCNYSSHGGTRKST
jgi:hypothetical protein